MSSVFNSSLLTPVALPQQILVDWKTVVKRNAVESKSTLRTGNANYFIINRSNLHLSRIDWARLLRPQLPDQDDPGKKIERQNLDFLERVKERARKFRADVETGVQGASSAAEAIANIRAAGNRTKADLDQYVDDAVEDAVAQIEQMSAEVEKQSLANLWSEAWSWVQGAIASIGSFIAGVVSKVVEFFKGIWDALVDAWDAVEDAVSSAWNAIKSIF